MYIVLFIFGQIHDFPLSMNAIKNSHEIPSQWFDVLISTLFKNKGSKKEQVNQRGIFLKQILSKIFERINMNRIKREKNRLITS